MIWLALGPVDIYGSDSGEPNVSGHIFSFATPSNPAAELHAPFGFGRGAHADGGGECSPCPLFTVTISPAANVC